MRHPAIAFAVLAGLAALSLALWLAPLWRGFDALRQLWPVWALAAPLALALAWPSRARWVRWAMVPLVAAILAPGAGETLHHWREPQAQANTAGFELRVATHNMWGRNASPERVVERLVAIDPDILALQESRNAAGTAGETLARLYPHAARCRSTQILSRYEIVEAGCIRRPGPIDRTTAIPCDWEVPPAVWARIRLPDGSTPVVVSVHMTWPFPGPTQDCQRGGLIDALDRLPHERMIVMGDFNAAAPSVALARMQGGLGLERRSIGIATFPAEGRFEQAGWPTPPVPPMLLGIDHVFAGEDWETAIIGVGPNTGSDHRPLVATLRLRATNLPPGRSKLP